MNSYGKCKQAYLSSILPSHVNKIKTLFSICRAHVTLQNHEYKASKIFIHAKYDQPKFANDIAIIELDADTEDNRLTNNSICLENSIESYLKSTLAIMRNSRSFYQYGKAKFINDTDCNSYLSRRSTVLTSGQFCANIQSNETEFSSFVGAIVFESNNQEQYSLKAFTSIAIRREQSLDESRTYVFSDVQNHLDWIQTILNGETSSPPSPLRENFQECSLSNANGYCVREEECALFSEAPRPLSRQQEAFLD